MHKLRYNKNHKNMKLIIEKYAFLYIYIEYTISEPSNRKLSQQRIKLFKILKKINHLIYKLKFLSLIKIHLIISIA